MRDTLITAGQHPWVLSDQDLSMPRLLALVGPDNRSEHPDQIVFLRTNWILAITLILVSALAVYVPRIGIPACALWFLTALALIFTSGGRPPGWARKGSGRPIAGTASPCPPSPWPPPAGKPCASSTTATERSR